MVSTSHVRPNGADHARQGAVNGSIDTLQIALLTLNFADRFVLPYRNLAVRVPAALATEGL